MSQIQSITVYPNSIYSIGDNEVVLSIQWDRVNKVFYVLVGPKTQAPQGN